MNNDINLSLVPLQFPETPEERKAILPILKDRLYVSPYYAKLIEERGDDFLEEWIDHPRLNSYPMEKRAPSGTLFTYKKL